MSRKSSHVIETNSTDIFRTKVNSFYSNGDALFRDVTERDYGIDGLIELFENECPTGMISLIQIKGKENTIVPLKKYDGVSCQISTSNVHYAFQKNIPVIVVYLSIKDNVFYYVCLNDLVDDISDEKMNNNKITIRIPNENLIVDDLEPMFSKIRDFYSEDLNYGNIKM